MGPLPPGLLDDPVPSTLVLDRNGRPLYEALSGDGTRGVRITADSIPPVLAAATLAAEDRRFFSHPGVDPLAVLRAVKTNLAERALVEGGSTITQQTAKLLLNRRSPRRSRGWTAKIHESVIALRLEHRFEKREILALYLNLAGYGNQIVGVERASRGYFGVPASMLTPAQAAFLAGLPQRPTRFNPWRNRELALSRQRVVLRRMEGAGALTSDQAQQARAEQLTFSSEPAPFSAPHFVEMVLAAHGGSRPARIDTTLDGGLQDDIRGIIDSHRPLLERHGAANVAVVVMQNATGDWLAWEGSGNYGNAAAGGTINGAIAPRQPGSALKPFTYALAFEEGHSPASVLADIPSTFSTMEEGIVYSPRNYDGQFRGPLLARVALAGSQNVPAVVLASEVGVPKLLRFLNRAGLTTFDKTASHYGLGVTLGNAEVRLDELTAAYAAFARGGTLIQPNYLAGNEVSSESRRIVSARTAFWITDILSDGEAREYVFGRGGSLEFPFPVAVKTGTSQAYHDNWTIGYSAHVTVGVWVGNFDRTPLRNSSGVTGAAPIFHAVMLAAEKRFGTGSAEILETPSSSVRREICALSGLSATAWCPAKRGEWTASERAPLACSWHHLSDEGVLTVWPPEYRAWAGTRLAVAPAAVPVAEGVSERAARKHVAREVRARSTLHVARDLFSIVSPADGATYLIDPTLRREFQTLSLRAVAPVRGTIHWSIDGKAFGSVDSDRRLDWPLTRGRHEITARDGSGRTASVSVTVR